MSTLTEIMSIGRKMNLLIDYLQAGGEIEIEGRTYVWLDNYVTHTTTNDNGELEYWGIDGLAIKGVKIDGSTGKESPHYMGQGGMPFQTFIHLIESVTEEDWVGIGASVALRSLNKKR